MAILLDTGAALFAQQSNGDIPSVVLTGFKVGSGVGEVMDSDITEPMGTLIYEGDTTQMFYTPMSDDTILITCIVPRLEPESRPGNLILYANDGIALFGSLSEVDIQKYKQTDISAGTRITYTILIRMPDLMDRFDFSNINARTAEMKMFDSDHDLTRWPYEEANDQIIIQADSRVDDKPAVVFNIMGLYYGVPLRDYADDDAFLNIET